MECGCAASFYGPSLGNTCGPTLLFMTLLDTFLRNKCDISEVCERVVAKSEPETEYDYVVIGGGSGGATAAGRLVEGNMGKVLLIEAGMDEPVGTQVPSMVVNWFDHPDIDWRFKTEPEPNACLGYPEKKCSWIRGKVLGGCGVLNGMMYMRGVPRDYDNWAAAGNTGWSYNDVLPYFKRQENNTQIGTLVDAQYHGVGGQLTVSQFPDHPQFADDILIAAKEAGYPVSQDLNGKQLTGFSIAQTNNRDGVRVSAARAFLRPHRNNPNLHVMLNSTATKIGVQNVNGKKQAANVQFIYNGRTHTVRVRKEVIVAGGTVNSPQILMLSGIGPKEELQRVGIPVVHELPGVGKNLKNHVSFYMSFILKKLNSTNDLDWAQAMNYILNHKGPMSSTGMSQVTGRVNSKYADPAGNYPDLQMFFAGFLAKCSATGEVKSLEDVEKPEAPKHVGMAPVYLHPKSRGHIGLKSSDPLEYPLIYANYLTEPEDIKTLVEGVRLGLQLAKSKHLVDKYGMELVKDEYGDCETTYPYDSDDYWQCALRHSTGPENHQIGTCKMGPASDPNAVVNPELQVHGIDNIRVMDASVMPELVSGNTAATVMMIADRGVDFIKNKRGVDLGNRGSFGEGGLSTNAQKVPVPPKRPYVYPKPHGPPAHGYGPPPHGFPHGPPPGYPLQGGPPPHGPNRGHWQHNYDFHKNHPELPNPFDSSRN